MHPANRVALLAAAALCVATASGSARADDADDSAASASARLAPTHKDEWYGGPIIATDASAIALGVAGFAVGGTGSAALGVTSFFVYGFGGPVVHGLHNQNAKGLIDLGLRFGLLAVGALIGFVSGWATAASSCNSTNSNNSSNNNGWNFPCLEYLSPPAEAEEGALVGAGIGGVMASFIDIAVLARGPVGGGDDGAGHDARADGLRLHPSFAFAREPHGGSPSPRLGIAGTF